jgi:hypothetical protein
MEAIYSMQYYISDLLEKAFVTEPKSEKILKQIVSDANEWCRGRMVHTSISQDYLDIWDSYAGFLDRGDPNWLNYWWAKEKPKLSTPSFKIQRVDLLT